MIESRDIAMKSLAELLHGGPSSDSIPWVEVVAVAQRSGLAPLLFWRLNKQKACEDSVPVVVWEALQRDYHAAVFQGVLREQELIRIIKALDQAGVAALLLKGAALAYSAYPSPWLRLMCDLDLLVDRTDLERVRGLLEALGYMHQPEPQRLNPFNRDFSCETAFLRTVGVDSTLVELHWDLITVEWFRRATALDIEALQPRAEPIGVWNVTALSLAPEDQLAHVCLHVSMHGFTYLRGYVDIAQIVKADRIEWDVFLERVRAARIGVACYFPLRWAKHAWHAPVPEEVLRALRPDRLRAWLGGRVIGRGEAPETDGARGWLHLAQLFVVDRLYDIPGVLLRLLFPGPAWVRERYRLRSAWQAWLWTMVHPFIVVWRNWVGV
jgi:hypothetical protein